MTTRIDERRSTSRVHRADTETGDLLSVARQCQGGVTRFHVPNNHGFVPGTRNERAGRREESKAGDKTLVAKKDAACDQTVTVVRTRGPDADRLVERTTNQAKITHKKTASLRKVVQKRRENG